MHSLTCIHLTLCDCAPPAGPRNAVSVCAGSWQRLFSRFLRLRAAAAASSGGLSRAAAACVAALRWVADGAACSLFECLHYDAVCFNCCDDPIIPIVVALQLRSVTCCDGIFSRRVAAADSSAAVCCARLRRVHAGVEEQRLAFAPLLLLLFLSAVFLLLLLSLDVAG